MSVEKALKFAEQICEQNRIITAQTLGKIFIYRQGLYRQIRSPKCDAELHKMIMDLPDGKTLMPSKRDQVIRNIEALTSVDVEDLNPEGLFCFQDGIYDVRYNNFAEHSPEYKVTVQLPYRFNSSVDAPIWMKFLQDVTQGNAEHIALLQEFCGYCLMKSCRFEKALFIIGRGSNGKSVFSDTIRKVFGSHNVSSVSLESLDNPVMRCNIIDKYINIDSDLPRNAERFEEAFRKISSGEPIQFNEKFIPSFTATPHCKLLYCLNEFPMIDDGSNAFYRRMILIPFDVEFVDGAQDVQLKQKLESELPGIFRWCVVGYNRLIRQGFTLNNHMSKLVTDIKEDNNPIIAFVNEEINIGDTTSGITKRGLYDAYADWCKRSGHRHLSHRKFNNRFYMEYRNHTEKDAQRPTEDRDRYWPNMSYKKKFEAIKRGEIVNSWSE